MPDNAPAGDIKGIAAQADLHHQYLLGLAWTITLREGA